MATDKKFVWEEEPLVPESIVKEREKAAKLEGLNLAAKAVCVFCDWGFPLIGTVGDSFYHSCGNDHSNDCKSPQKCMVSEIHHVIKKLSCDS